jgi:hypothetical protein
VTSVKSYLHRAKLYLLGRRRSAPASNARFTRSKAHKISHLPSFQPHFTDQGDQGDQGDLATAAEYDVPIRNWRVLLDETLLQDFGVPSPVNRKIAW